MLLFYWTEILLFMLSSPLFCNKVFVLSSNTSLVWLLLSQVLDEQLVGLLKEYILYQHFCWNVIFAVFFFFYIWKVGDITRVPVQWALYPIQPLQNTWTIAFLSMNVPAFALTTAFLSLNVLAFALCCVQAISFEMPVLISNWLIILRSLEK